jgi:hypothetical protein
MKYTQVLVSSIVGFLLYGMSKDEKKGLWTVGLYMLSPVQIFFAQSLWSETIYGFILVLCVWLFHKRATSIWMGLLLSCGILLRGVSLYLLPIFGWFLWRRKQSLILLLMTVFICVGPYSLYASRKFERLIISDRTLGQMMWLGNNDFSPMTFDWGTGAISNFSFERSKKKDVYGCPPRPKKKSTEIRNRWSMERQDCLVQKGQAWILDHPKEFLERIPIRLAQLSNPHSFLTRHIRTGGWRGLSEWTDEFLVLWGAGISMLVLWFGSIGLVVRRKTERGRFVLSILLYHVLAIAFLAGLSRYRVPLEPLLMLYAGDFLGGGWKEIDRSSLRISFLALCVLTPLMLWHLPAGWSWWKSYS